MQRCNARCVCEMLSLAPCNTLKHEHWFMVVSVLVTSLITVNDHSPKPVHTLNHKYAQCTFDKVAVYLFGV